jgi:PD-(D/E)XK endonuclease
VLSSDEKGVIAETAIAHAAAKLGIGVLRPMSGGARYDLAFDLGTRFLRVQCKWARRHGGVILVRCCSSRRGRDQFLRLRYTSNEVDAIAAYCPDVDRCYFLPAAVIEGRAQISLRLASPRNGQRLRIRRADDFDFTRLDWESISGP